MTQKTIAWEVTPQTAWVIEVSRRRYRDKLLHITYEMPMNFGEHPWELPNHIVFTLGRAIVVQRNEKLELNEKEIWCLWEIVEPEVKVGNVSGFDVLSQIGRLLLEMHAIQIPGGGITLLAEKPEEENANENETDSTSNTSARAENRPEAAIES